LRLPLLSMFHYNFFIWAWIQIENIAIGRLELLSCLTCKHRAKKYPIFSTHFIRSSYWHILIIENKPKPKPIILFPQSFIQWLIEPMVKQNKLILPILIFPYEHITTVRVSMNKPIFMYHFYNHLWKRFPYFFRIYSCLFQSLYFIYMIAMNIFHNK
jgi:hypothetical protein